MDLHLNYESVEPYPLERGETPSAFGTSPKSTGEKTPILQTSADLGEAVRGSPLRQPTTRLLARKEQGIIEIDTATTLRGVPAEAWEYRLGTYSALEWILERYKEKKPKDPTIAEKFNTYRFADYKEQVIELLSRVCTVSVETMKIVKEMPS
jgi:predicted helicase